jgi:hypothetical protein
MMRLPLLEVVERTERAKKTDVFDSLEAFEHVGLFVNWPPDPAGVPFI